MNKQNRNSSLKCKYCANQATGILYRAKDQLDNVLSCTFHATNLFIPFKDSKYDKRILQESRYRSPMKKSQMSFSNISQIQPQQTNPEQYFDRLMENIIQEFNSMKKEVMANYAQMKNLKKGQDALKFKMQGDPSFPYILINNDETMLVNHFVARVLSKHNQQEEKAKRQKILKRRMQLSTIISSQNLPTNKSPDFKQATSVLLTRSVQGSPQNLKNETSMQKTTERRTIFSRDYSKTQKRQKN